MDSMIITEHLPLITTRIPFTLSPPPALSPVTARTEFLDLEEPLETPRKSSPSTLSHTTSPLKPSGSVVFFGAHKETATGEGEMGKLKGIEEEEVEKEQNEADEITMLIPKPQGEPGRPQCGGYSLDDVLDWGAETLSKVTFYVKGAAEKELDTRVSYAKQNHEKLNSICEEAHRHFPVLSMYANTWPVRDILKLHLKYTSETHRRNEALRKPRKPIGKKKASTGKDLESEQSM